MNQDAIGRTAIGLSVGCVAVLAATIASLVSPGIRSTLGLMPAAARSYQHGEHIDVPSSLYGSSPYTVVLFARSDCGVCQRIKPWLSETIAAVEGQTPAKVMMVATNSRLDEEVFYAREIGLGPERVVQLASTTLKVRQVPTLVLVDRRGTVQYSVDGAPNISTADLISRITTLTESR
jgi:hypothetical protein